MDTILSIDKLHKQYPDFELKNLSFTLKPGEVMGFIGENGREDHHDRARSDFNPQQVRFRF
ncbi:MAG: hypothetical protein ACLSA6_20275 [Holdemania massiliensis]